MLEWAARAGYAARGFVYVSIGVLALLAALELAPAAAGSEEAVAAVADWPFGRVWLAAIAAGLAGFAAWRVLQSLFDADRQGVDAKALAARAGQGVSALVYGGLALSVYQALDTVADASETLGGDPRQGAARVLELPFGGTLLLLVGVFVGGVGVAGLVRAARGGFSRRLACRQGLRRTAEWLGRLGYGGRGLAFFPLGFFLAEAGLDRNAAEARSLGETLQALERQPFGSLVLTLVAVGLVAFGLYAFIEARYRRIVVPEPA